MLRVVFAALLVALAAAGPARGGDKLVRLATTTSTDNSGLIKHLAPLFARDTGYQLQALAVGTGRALALGERGDVDVILAHAPAAEAAFVAAGYGVGRRAVMENDFLIVGPRGDPAQLRAAASAADAFARLAAGGDGDAQIKFVSRGDDSGTHKKEMALWRAAGIAADWRGRREVGQSMGRSLQVADELQAYLLIDRGTWIFLRAQTTLAVAFAGGRALRNPYSIIAVNPERAPVNFAGATALSDWLTSAAGQAAIGDYTVNGARLFTPTAARQ